MKRQQKYCEYFRGLWPEILNIGRDGSVAYFDMKYIEGSQNLYEYITNNNLSVQQYKNLVDLVFEKLGNMHGRAQFPGSAEAAELYLFQEIEKSLHKCVHPEFLDFIADGVIIIEGVEVPSFLKMYDKYKSLFIKTYNRWFEVLTHGNATLENMLYVPSQNELWFIDPYEENVLDSELADYSQVLQSCHSRYELLNEAGTLIKNNRIEIFPNHAKGMRMAKFSVLFKDRLYAELGERDYLATKLLNVSQFIRMLPFKQEKDIEKMKFFYAWASMEFYNILSYNELETDY